MKSFPILTWFCATDFRNSESLSAPQTPYFAVMIPEGRNLPVRPPASPTTAISFLGAAERPLNRATISPNCVQLSLEVFTVDGAGSTLEPLVWFGGGGGGRRGKGGGRQLLLLMEYLCVRH